LLHKSSGNAAPLLPSATCLTNTTPDAAAAPGRRIAKVEVGRGSFYAASRTTARNSEMTATNADKLTQAFVEALQIDAAQVTDSLQYNTIKEWDSVAHMTLIAALEEQFDIMLDTDDIIDMSSVAKAKEILAKYDVSI
jgi:acyl carrier protein